ncbi:MAG: acetate kinase, partial [Moraxellaceae bacterium]
MSASILVINCGSSSVKYALVEDATGTTAQPRISGLAENLGTAQARIRMKQADGSVIEHLLANANHTDALAFILQQLAGYQP